MAGCKPQESILWIPEFYVVESWGIDANIFDHSIEEAMVGCRHETPLNKEIPAHGVYRLDTQV
jgi:hypothetical protein